MAYVCLNCNTVHGWEVDPRVAKVTRHHRGQWEDIWYCPSCGRQHRTHDGSMMGQAQKMWREVNIETLGRQVLVCDMYGGAYMTYEGAVVNGRYERTR